VGKAKLVQKIGWIIAVICILSWIASEIKLPADDAKAVAVAEEFVWRRTAEGWEKIDEWTYELNNTPPLLHPGVMALFMITLTLGVGVAKIESAK
jgi:hypothetical protein